MKKVLRVIIVLVAVAAACGLAFWALYSFGVFSEDSNEPKVIVTEVDGLKTTVRNWDWSPIESKEVISYVDVSAVPTRTVAMHLEGVRFYDVTIPDVEIINDFGKTIWAVDGSFTIRVINGATLDNMSTLAGLKNSQSINQLTLCNKDGEKGSRTIVTLVDNFIVLANINCGNENYSVICNSLSGGTKPYTYTGIPVVDDLDQISIEQLKYTGEFSPQVTLDEVSITAQRYLFEEGELWIQSDLNPLYKSKEIYLARLVKYASTSIDTVYYKDDVYYASAGDYHLALKSYNSNTTIVMIGKGDECKCNIFYALESLQ